jgi:hypothetical protein
VFGVAHGLVNLKKERGDNERSKEKKIKKKEKNEKRNTHTTDGMPV